MHVSVSLSIGLAFRQADVTVSSNSNGVSNSNSTASPEYKKCLNFVCEMNGNYLDLFVSFHPIKKMFRIFSPVDI